jgi:hypothetical protein
MLRVSKVDERSRTVITIDGQLSGDYIEAVKTCYDQAISTGKPVTSPCAMCPQSTKAARLGIRWYQTCITRK